MDYERTTQSDGQRAQDSQRVGVAMLCEVRQGTRPWKMARLEDLSPGGFRIAWLPDARPEIPLRIRIPGMQLLTARICWARGNAVGCEFAEPLHVAVFEHIARSGKQA
ncbi:PilZ domain-containing protein [Novosphingobium beihaiensis]|uniref:PilZ domain-containing protein n=1 Tax=Novosphingobium beihaiensis TaxID=2930389 RepID=A0ABT0BN21_9SPHN|nr:PilZ domain-containing protein [Novosphingobium beihaiensis]MCJ2186360.1 PilZ domain-containing protein [Novosphingobium beihaiensis]